MNASKENARKARSIVEGLAADEAVVLGHGESKLRHLQSFVESAERKLPTEAAYKRDRERRKK